MKKGTHIIFEDSDDEGVGDTSVGNHEIMVNMYHDNEDQAMEDGDQEAEVIDLYAALHVGESERPKFDRHRARASYHRLSFRYHPTYGEEGCENKFKALTIAYLVFKDEDRKRIYDDHGYKVLLQSEKYMEPNIFDIDPFEYYDEFFAGKDPDDREYLLLNGPQVNVSDSENEEHDDDEEEDEENGENHNKEEEDEDEDDDEEMALDTNISEQEIAEQEKKRKQIEALRMPFDPRYAQPSMMRTVDDDNGVNPHDIFQEIKKKFEN